MVIRSRSIILYIYINPGVGLLREDPVKRRLVSSLCVHECVHAALMWALQT